MSEFCELIRSVDKTRRYMRDFTIYGFKHRGEYTYKSPRTYDNERRRIESWLAGYIRWEYSPQGKHYFVAVNSAHVAQNPLYAIWKSKTFTKNDITLHFLLPALLAGGPLTVSQMADQLQSRWQLLLEPQTIRLKLREYEAQGLVSSVKTGNRLAYALAADPLPALDAYPALLEAVKFFQEAAPLGFVGSTLLDRERLANDRFGFKHHFIVHTLDDGVLGQLLAAMARQQAVTITQVQRKKQGTLTLTGLPLRILTSTQSGRRYLCLYRSDIRRFVSVRLDTIETVAAGEACPDYPALQGRLSANLPQCWGVSFGSGHLRQQTLSMVLRVGPDEDYILERLRREGRGGAVTQLDDQTYRYEITTFDVNEMMSWVKSFTGRIVSLETSRQAITQRFYDDMARMYGMYCGGEAEQP